MKLTDYIVRYLKFQKVDTVFGYTGGSIADLVDSICRSKDVRFVQNYNEQASSFCANAYAAVTKKTGVAISSSGPGAINMINGIANAYFDSVPCLFITGNVHSLARNTSDNIRQNAFQETDIVAIVKSITKYAVYLEKADDIQYELEKAFHIANEGRKGPVLIDIPYDIQRQDIDISKLKKFTHQDICKKVLKTTDLYNLIEKSIRPLIIVGGGCQDSRTEIFEFVKKVQIPVVATMRGLDVLDHDCPYYIGFLGTYGNRSANLAIKYSDLLIVLGARLDERQMGYRKSEFAPFANVVQVDIDAAELGRKVECSLQVNCDVKLFLGQALKSKKFFVFSDWLQLLQELKSRYPSTTDLGSNYNAANFLNYVSQIIEKNAVITLDVGQNQIISAQALKLSGKQHLLCSAGLACMGYSLPAAIGACYADSSVQIVSINGDGGFQMNIQELETISREKLPLKIIVLHNNALGLIQKLQEKLFDKRYFASIQGFSCPNLEKIADVYNLKYLKICDTSDYCNIKSILNDKSACLIDVILPADMKANPEPGATISEQLPSLSMPELRDIEHQVQEISK